MPSVDRLRQLVFVALKKVPGFTAALSVLGLRPNHLVDLACQQCVVMLFSELKCQTVVGVNLIVKLPFPLFFPTSQWVGNLFIKQA